jgi:hypothetical protein
MAAEVTNDNWSEQKCERPAEMFAGRSSLSPRIDNDEWAIDRSNCRGVGARAQSE